MSGLIGPNVGILAFNLAQAIAAELNSDATAADWTMPFTAEVLQDVEKELEQTNTLDVGVVAGKDLIEDLQSGQPSYFDLRNDIVVRYRFDADTSVLFGQLLQLTGQIEQFFRPNPSQVQRTLTAMPYANWLARELKLLWDPKWWRQQQYFAVVNVTYRIQAADVPAGLTLVTTS
jgi:hypothetical protein